MADSTEPAASRQPSCVDCGAPALDRFDDLDDRARSVWLCLRCIKARYTSLARWFHVEVDRP